MRKLLALSVCLMVCATSTAQAHSTHVAKVKFYKASGVVRWIGSHARTTQYNPDPRIKRRWQHAVHYWVGVREKQWAILHPKPRYVALGFPPHHALWVCISHYEGSPTSVNPNGHYGMLQMHWNWGYGIKGAASNYSQAAQEWAAERGYAASGYSYSFLNDQWYRYDAADGCGT